MRLPGPDDDATQILPRRDDDATQILRRGTPQAAGGWEASNSTAVIPTREGGDMPTHFEVIFPQHPVSWTVRIAIILIATVLLHIASIVANVAPITEESFRIATFALCVAFVPGLIGIVADQPKTYVGGSMAFLVCFACIITVLIDGYMWVRPVLAAQGWVS